jgi:hypothetical protein
MTEVANRMADEATLRGIPIDENTNQGKSLYLLVVNNLRDI